MLSPKHGPKACVALTFPSLFSFFLTPKWVMVPTRCLKSFLPSTFAHMDLLLNLQVSGNVILPNNPPWLVFLNQRPVTPCILSL